MAKKDLVKCIEIEYLDECFYRIIAISTNEKAMKFRLQNKKIDWCRCRFDCPIYKENGCCNFYLALSEINFSPILI